MGCTEIIVHITENVSRTAAIKNYPTICGKRRNCQKVSEKRFILNSRRSLQVCCMIWEKRPPLGSCICKIR